MSTDLDLLALTADLMAIPSESYQEAALVEWLHAELSELEHLEVHRVGDNLVARTTLGRPTRVLLGGHTDTVPANDNATPRIEGDRLHGVGSADMKSGLAVMLASARTHREPAVDLTYVFYAREEVAAADSGLGELFERRPDLLAADVALLGEPTDGALEAGCQGSLRARVTLRGARAHTARPWMGRNAIHRLGGLLDMLERYEARRPVIDGCEFREALLAVAVEGGVAGNVVPDEATVTVAHRFAPDHTPEQAETVLRAAVAPWLEDGDSIEVTEVANAAPPALSHPVVAELVRSQELEVRAKLGWTDVARFAAVGIPAANFGPGEPTVAHRRDEYVDRSQIERVWRGIESIV